MLHLAISAELDKWHAQTYHQIRYGNGSPVVPYQIFFQLPGTPYMLGISDLHQHIMTVIVGVLIFVFYFLFVCIFKYNSKKNRVADISFVQCT
jgi:heme/copper-type cytochrome/quinol oxidase subunit 2